MHRQRGRWADRVHNVMPPLMFRAGDLPKRLRGRPARGRGATSLEAQDAPC
ncbi:hypothetical protein D516_0116 [Rhodobacter sp. AKP1]|nr:Hypothetical Protein RSKD131_3296 [Cereibacter sphaeroides KD131]EKX59760.1 hypothetical protein D516_0116 [Rhodobacter sp. AKP1]